jgi:hypothetical protein
MPIDNSRLAEIALEALEEKRRKLDDEIKEIRARLSGGGSSRAAKAGGKASTGTGNGRRRKRRRMSAAQKKLVSDRMKQYWAERKKGKR